MKYSRNKIRWLVLVVALMVMPAVAQVRDTIDFDINDRSLETITIGNETFSQYSYPDCDHIDQTGAPMLPVKYIRLSVPHNATNITVTGAGSWTSEALGRRIYPAPEPLTTNDPIPEEPKLVIDSAIYMSNAYWPASPAELVGEGFYMGENHIVTVAIYPTLYNPVQNKMHNYTQVRVKVSYDPGGTPANMLVRRGGDLRQQEQQAAKAIVDNPHQVEGFAVPAAQAHHMPAHGLIPDSLLTDTASYYYGGELYTWGDRARYLIVTTRELAPSFKRLAALKRQKGYSVQIKCIEDILADPRVQDGDEMIDSEFNTPTHSTDDASKLRQYLKLSYSFDNTQFVLLGGKNIPFRCHIRPYLKNGIEYRDSVPTDWYYSDLTSKWIKNCELTPEFYEYHSSDGHDLLVGRLMADTQNEIENYTDKLLRYELNPGYGDTSYLNRCLVVQGSELNPKLSTGTIMANAYSQITPNATLIIQQGHNYPTGGDVISLINTNKYGILSIHGHGNPYATAVNDWNTGYMYNDSTRPSGHHSYQRISSLDEYYSDINNGLDCLTNKYYPGIYYSWSCDNAPFDNYQRSYYLNYDYNMAQSYVLGKDYGGVAFLGNTRSGYISTSVSEEGLDNSPKIEKNFAQLLSQGMLRLSEAEAMSKELNNGSRSTHLRLTHNLHGDPEFKIWDCAPQHFANYSIERNNNGIIISGLSSQNSIALALVSNDNYSIQDTITDSSISFNNVSPNSCVMILGDGYMPSIAPLYLQNERIENSQYVIANDVYAGRNVDSNRTIGDLTITDGIEYEIDAKGSVVLAPGFTVEKGALFSVTRSDY